jgi:hypothetical protein
VEEKKDEKKFTDRNRKMLNNTTVHYGSASMYIARLACSVHIQVLLGVSGSCIVRMHVKHLNFSYLTYYILHIWHSASYSYGLAGKLQRKLSRIGRILDQLLYLSFS